MPRTHHSPLPFPLASQVNMPDQARGNRRKKLAADHRTTVNVEKGHVAFGMKGGFGVAGYHQSHHTSYPAPARLSPPLRAALVCASHPLCNAPPLLISLMAQEQRQGLRSRNHFTDSSKESFPLSSLPSPARGHQDLQTLRHIQEYCKSGSLEEFSPGTSQFFPLISTACLSEKFIDR